MLGPGLASGLYQGSPFTGPGIQYRQHQIHRRWINTEEKAKVVAAMRHKDGL